MVGDAFGVIAYAIENLKITLTGQSLRDELALIGTASLKAFQGLSGSIAFGSNGDPINKALVLLEVVASSITGENTVKLVGTSSQQ
jgi:ABC-type branched-subunit amino acid transport system substrate-binding protein